MPLFLPLPVAYGWYLGGCWRHKGGTGNPSGDHGSDIHTAEQPDQGGQHQPVRTHCACAHACVHVCVHVRRCMHALALCHVCTCVHMNVCVQVHASSSDPSDPVEGSAVGALFS